MFSAIFIERSRLASVIAIVTTVAGLLSLLVIPANLRAPPMSRCPSFRS